MHEARGHNRCASDLSTGIHFLQRVALMHWMGGSQQTHFVLDARPCCRSRQDAGFEACEADRQANLPLDGCSASLHSRGRQQQRRWRFGLVWRSWVEVTPLVISCNGSNERHNEQCPVRQPGRTQGGAGKGRLFHRHDCAPRPAAFNGQLYGEALATFVATKFSAFTRSQRVQHARSSAQGHTARTSCIKHCNVSSRT